MIFAKKTVQGDSAGGKCKKSSYIANYTTDTEVGSGTCVWTGIGARVTSEAQRGVRTSYRTGSGPGSFLVHR